MLKLIKFFESKCIESKVYWRVPVLYDEGEYEIEWHRDRKKKWHLRKYTPDSSWEVISSEDLLKTLNSKKIDIYMFEKKLSATFLQQIVFAKMLYDEALEHFGEDTVNHAVEETENFLKRLKSMVIEIIGKKDSNNPLKNDPMPSIKLVKK